MTSENVSFCVVEYRELAWLEYRSAASMSCKVHIKTIRTVPLMCAEV
jgi:hypothetical protein